MPGGLSLKFVTDDLVVVVDGEGAIPTIDDVAALLRARTRDKFGKELGYFNDDTRPTADQVQNYIDGAVTEVVIRLPDTVPEKYLPLVRRVVALRAAMEVELSYDPDRAHGGTSAWSGLHTMFNENMSILSNALEDVNLGPKRHMGAIVVGSATSAPVPGAVPSMFPHWTVEI